MGVFVAPDEVFDLPEAPEPSAPSPPDRVNATWVLLGLDVHMGAVTVRNTATGKWATTRRDCPQPAR